MKDLFRSIFKLNNVFSFILVLLLSSGCAVQDIKVDSINLQPRGDQQLNLPINARAEVVVPLGKGDNQIIVTNQYRAWALDDGEAIKATAKEVFKKLFKEIENRGEIDDPHFIIKVKADSSVNTFWGTYTVKAQTDIAYGNGKNFGHFQAEGKEISALISDQNALENAYRKAFLQTTQDILNDQSALDLLKEGVNDTEIRVTDKTSTKLNSQYKNLTDAVVTVIVEMSESKKNIWVTDDRPFTPHGSGFFVNKNGIILTNFHVIDNAKAIKIKTYDGKEFIAKVLAKDEWTDLAILEINLTETPFLTLSDSITSFSVGDAVIAVGSPIKTGLDHSLSQGIVSSIRLIDGNKVIQTDAAVNPGSSGGPLVLLSSQKVIGIVTLGIQGAEGIGFAIPTDVIKNFIEQNKNFYTSKK